VVSVGPESNLPVAANVRLSARIFRTLIAACFSQIVAPSAAIVAEQSRPNIVFILIDDAGFSDFGSCGGEIATPNLDQIAKEGVRFTNFHAASTCEATRVMLQSGIDNYRAGAGTLQVVIADNQKGKPGYEDLSDQAPANGTSAMVWNVPPEPKAGTATSRWNRQAPTTTRRRSMPRSIWRLCGGKTAIVPCCRRTFSRPDITSIR
jgi:hypothetical protein